MNLSRNRVISSSNTHVSLNLRNSRFNSVKKRNSKLLSMTKLSLLQYFIILLISIGLVVFFIFFSLLLRKYSDNNGDMNNLNKLTNTVSKLSKYAFRGNKPNYKSSNNEITNKDDTIGNTADNDILKRINEIEREKYEIKQINHQLDNRNINKNNISVNHDNVDTFIPTPTPTLDPARTFFGFPCGTDMEKVTAPPGNILERHLCLLPSGKKIGLKQDIRVILQNDEDNNKHMRRNRHNYSIPATNILGKPRALLEAQIILKNHPIFNYKVTNSTPYRLDNIMYYLKSFPMCSKKPIFLSMATVGDDLYKQLIENFVYTMVKFNLSDCSLVICVSDIKCMNLCQESNFPCFNYKHDTPTLPSVMEQIAIVKLYHTPKALIRGVDIFMLDLDVGFLADPMYMIKAFYETPLVDIFVQEDLLFIMNRTKAGWKTWFNEPLPNIGLFLCRGNEKTARVFDIAWKKYQQMDNLEMKAHPGKDQNHVLEAMRIGRGTFGLRYAYFSNNTAVLLDKMVQNAGRLVELGGLQAGKLFNDQRSLAVHTTCYEHTTKVMGLKASNAFWNPRYYDPLRPTIVKQILFLSENQVLDEIRSLMWLCMALDRALIIPNLLGSEEVDTVEKYNNHSMWPGFRVSKLKRVKGSNYLNIDILEPAYYWRVDRDYDDVPEPTVIYFDKNDDLLSIKKDIEDNYKNHATSRIILHGVIDKKNLNEKIKATVDSRIKRWAIDTVGYYDRPFSYEEKRYLQVPSVKNIRKAVKANDVLQGVRNCQNIFGPLKGNRTCFQICD